MRAFLVLALCAASTAAWADDVVTKPGWSVKPTVQDLVRYYPANAAKLKVSGQATITCMTTERGTLESCQAVSEYPAGYGFGEAAVKMSRVMRMTPATVNGTPVMAPVSVPVNFAIPKDHASEARGLVG